VYPTVPLQPLPFLKSPCATSPVISKASSPKDKKQLKLLCQALEALPPLGLPPFLRPAWPDLSFYCLTSVPLSRMSWATLHTSYATLSRSCHPTTLCPQNLDLAKSSLNQHGIPLLAPGAH
jgi:hypothetical protein